MNQNAPCEHLDGSTLSASETKKLQYFPTAMTAPAKTCGCKQGGGRSNCRRRAYTTCSSIRPNTIIWLVILHTMQRCRRCGNVCNDGWSRRKTHCFAAQLRLLQE